MLSSYILQRQRLEAKELLCPYHIHTARFEHTLQSGGYRRHAPFHRSSWWRAQRQRCRKAETGRQRVSVREYVPPSPASWGRRRRERGREGRGLCWRIHACTQFIQAIAHTAHPREQLLCPVVPVPLVGSPDKRPSNEVHLLFSALPREFRSGTSETQELRMANSVHQDLQLGSGFSTQILVISAARGDEG